MAVHLTRIYTRTGDDGTSGLSDFSRVEKSDARLIAYADCDEANAAIGVAVVLGQPDESLRAVLTRIQNDLFDLGADLCRPDMERDHEAGYVPLRILERQVLRLEAEIDAMNVRLQPLRSFILPGGSALAAHLHVCRTVSRRAERLTVELATMEAINTEAVKYLNRLSDWFFVAGRIANNDGKDDVLWVPGLTRDV